MEKLVKRDGWRLLARSLATFSTSHWIPLQVESHLDQCKAMLPGELVKLCRRGCATKCTKIAQLLAAARRCSQLLGNSRIFFIVVHSKGIAYLKTIRCCVGRDMHFDHTFLSPSFRQHCPFLPNAPTHKPISELLDTSCRIAALIRLEVFPLSSCQLQSVATAISWSPAIQSSRRGIERPWLCCARDLGIKSILAPRPPLGGASAAADATPLRRYVAPLHGASRLPHPLQRWGRKTI